ncbi:pullulanase [candidate division KSB1 bacterium]|nr:pullulanase [candidate division KSB1 bacterium]
MKKYAFLFLPIIIFISCMSTSDSRYEDFHPYLNQYDSNKTLGAIVTEDSTIFRLFAPRSTRVTLQLFDDYYSSDHTEYDMNRDDNSIWELGFNGQLYGSYYGYRIWGPEGDGEMFNPDIVIADPYSKAVVTQNNYHHAARSLLIDDTFEWSDTDWKTPPISDIIIYEMHVRDMTAHPSSGCSAAGTYTGLTEKAIEGGIDYLIDLGVNAVELLPIHDFANIELPYRDSTTFIENTWNPYEGNHWGYMTSYFFAPESYYAHGESLTKNDFCGQTGEQISQLKTLINTFHQNGIAVILDVVYNHVSQYDYNPFKYIDKKYYFRLDQFDNFLGYSGCGNDFMTERPMARRLIIDSITYWVREYHIDGFRFDLAYLIDPITLQEIYRAVREINPNAYIIAEPWGGGYDPAGFSRMGWAAWNDKFRNGVKGQNPYDNHGFIFGEKEKNTNFSDLQNFIVGTLESGGGLFQTSHHSINYLESHDDHTMGDFIRIASGEVDPSKRILDVAEHAKLSPKQMLINKLAAIYLLTSQGVPMIHSGQEFARSKVIQKTEAPDTNWGYIDHNSYEKDNFTNYINFDHAKVNRELVDYYKSLIQIRTQHPAFRKSSPADIEFISCDNPYAFGYRISGSSSGDDNDFMVLLNGDAQQAAVFSLELSGWSLLTDEHTASITPIKELTDDHLSVPPTSGYILMR